MDTRKALKKAIKIVKNEARASIEWILFGEGAEDYEYAEYDELMQIQDVLMGLIIDINEGIMTGYYLAVFRCDTNEH